MQPQRQQFLDVLEVTAARLVDRPTRGIDEDFGPDRIGDEAVVVGLMMHGGHFRFGRG